MCDVSDSGSQAGPADLKSGTGDLAHILQIYAPQEPCRHAWSTAQDGGTVRVR